MTCGPWRPINLEVFSSRISDLYFTSNVDKSLRHAEFVAKADIEGTATDVLFNIALDGKDVASQIVTAQNGHATLTFQIQDPALWFPIRYGEQPLYTITATLFESDKTELHSVSKKFGLRRAELIQRPMTGQPGTT